MAENEISRQIVVSAVEVHRTLGGPGLLESVYEEALVWELKQPGLSVRRQAILPIPYKGTILASPLRIDVIVGDLVIVECKAVAQYNAIFEAQALNLPAANRNETANEPVSAGCIRRQPDDKMQRE